MNCSNKVYDKIQLLGLDELSDFAFYLYSCLASLEQFHYKFPTYWMLP